MGELENRDSRQFHFHDTFRNMDFVLKGEYAVMLQSTGTEHEEIYRGKFLEHVNQSIMGMEQELVAVPDDQPELYRAMAKYKDELKRVRDAVEHGEKDPNLMQDLGRLWQSAFDLIRD